MKTHVMTTTQRSWAIFATLFVLTVAAACQPVTAALAVGSAAPPFTLTDASGKVHTLAQYSGKTVVLEWINPNCPFSRRQAVEKAMIGTIAQYPDVVWLAINSTNSGHGDFLTPAQHLAWNAEHAITYPVLYDSSGDIGRAYGAQTTPHMYIIDPQGRVTYNGAIDDDPPGRKATKDRVNYVAKALGEAGRGTAITTATTKAYGCTIKY